VYAIEAALRGTRVLAVDGRTERMCHGAEIAARLGLTNLTFEQNDVRNMSVESHGEFDIVYFLGILYHLNVPECFRSWHMFTAFAADGC
jgi:2-polyprenyl-3-methyl-5-hydroxy-6-metoxy-1,4-benzoquinol methylase